MPTATARRAEWTDAVFDAIAALRRVMRCGNPRLELTAAQEVIKLETARMRHGRPVAGTEGGPPELTDPGELPPRAAEPATAMPPGVTPELADRLFAHFDNLATTLPSDLTDAEWEAAALASLGHPPTPAGRPDQAVTGFRQPAAYGKLAGRGAVRPGANPGSHDRPRGAIGGQKNPDPCGRPGWSVPIHT